MVNSRTYKSLEKPNFKQLLTGILVVFSIIAPQVVNAVSAAEAVEESIKAIEVKKEKPKNLPVVRYKKHAKKGFVVYVNNKQAVWFITNTGKYTAEKRAQAFVGNLQKQLQNGLNPRDIKPCYLSKNIVIRAGKNYLLTVDAENAKAYGVSVHELAFKWANDTRIAMGSPKLVRDYSQVASRSSYNVDFEKRYLGKVYNGKASWYGGKFHGRVSSDGSRFNMNEFTAAHKYLPFGTLVKVTNKKNNKSCVVKITDRGPYTGGRIIDLSKGAAKQVGMLSSGVSYVQLEVLGKY